MKKQILITGGAGFIGSHLADELLEKGYEVTVLDNLSVQVHGIERKKPQYLNRNVKFIQGDVRDKSILKKSLKGIDVVFHFAAMVGVGQSMYQLREYTDVNNTGTAVLLECLIDQPVEKLVVASSMSIYGEGLYKDASDHTYINCERSIEQLKRGNWELWNKENELLIPLPTPEYKPAFLTSLYALSKYDQEKMCLMIGKAYNIPTVALRFFNVYGTRQSLSNPYTGVLAIFASRLLNNNKPLIFEDGNQQRDFVSVHDVAYACGLAMERPEANGKVLNIGSGNKYTIREIAEKLVKVTNKGHLQPEINGKYRVGDIRHCYADISRAREVLGYSPRVDFEKGLLDFAEWLKGQIADDRVVEASQELATRGLTV